MHIPSRFAPLARLPGAPRLRRALRVLAWAGLGLYFALGLMVLVLRHFVLPAVGDYREDIERSLSQALGQPVAIRSIDAHWRKLWPSLRIHGLEIRDAEGRPALGFGEIDADIAWSSLWHLAPHFARLEIKAPRLDLRRTADGRLFVAGLEIKSDESSGAGFPDWLMSQDRIVIRDATINWHDELRQAPLLSLAAVNLDLRNGGSRHRFGLTAEPPRALAARVDIRGDITGDDLAAIDSWRGQLYAELDYADLAGWRAWVDYPVELPRGSGGLRLWLDIEKQTLAGATADLRLAGTAVRLAPDLPMLDLVRVDGRLSAQRDDDGFRLQTRRLALLTRDGIRIEPSDIDFYWQPGSGRRPPRGEVGVNHVDIGALAALAAYLPFEAAVRDRIVAWGPQGRVRDLSASWAGEFEALESYRLKTRFENLGLNAQGTVPGFFGLDGAIEASEKGGSIELASRAATLGLPAVFEESDVVLATLEASAEWTLRDGALDVSLKKASFQNADAVGEASGRYRNDGRGPGEIDLSARLTRADGGAVWRYMPLVVGGDVRVWLRDSITGGLASATLRLKGDLARFPFNDGSGVFEVKGPFQGASLKYAEGWPAFENVNGDLLFSGARMLIRAQSASLWNVRLADVKAEIADLDSHEPVLVVTGGVRGPTADFLRFIDESPVGGYIDNVTETMKAAGNGELRLRLDLPLHAIGTTRVDGRYRFLANQLVYYPDLPPVTDINGELHFTEKGLEGRKIRGTTLGAPVTVDIATEDGRVAVQANGSASVAALRQYYTTPLLEHLAGSAPWSGVIRVRKRGAEVRVESSLLGVSSSLPEPFNKTAGDAMPLAFELKALPEPPAPKGARALSSSGERDRIEVSLGSALRAQLQRRHDDGKAVVERGLIAIDAPAARLPERGVLLAMKAARLDADFWNGMAGEGGGGLLSQLELQTGELRGFGRSIHDLNLTGRLDGRTWRFDVRSNEAVGRIEWTSGETEDRLTARLARLDIPDAKNPATRPTTTESTERLPAVDLKVDQLMWHGRELGRLNLLAGNSAGIWSALFRIANKDGEIDGTSSWQEPLPGSDGTSAMDFRLTAHSIEGMLERLGYPNAVRRGSATLTGQVYWDGAPTRIDYPSLGGNLTLEASRGQFKKLEPGVGRLLGVLSLQSIPRRVSLDFRDIFSEGFAFESIDGKANISQGVLRTEEFEISGPAAKVMMNGQVNLVNETQDLKVRIQPAIGETIATGVLLVNPVIGASAWLMNRMFGNPIDKAFAFDYSVTGPWTDPKVEKVAVQAPRAALNVDQGGVQ
jgi:uncharacterized protein (TIGR02099 family)